MIQARLSSRRGAQGLRLRLLGMGAALLGLVTGLLVLGTVNATATGGADVWLRADGVWRTQTFTVYDPTVPSACPGPTGQGLTITATMKGTASSFTVQSIYMKNTTAGVSLDKQVIFDGFVRWADPLSAWPYGTTKRLAYINGGTLTSTKPWEGTSKNLGIHELTVSNGGGLGCYPVFQILFHRY